MGTSAFAVRVLTELVEDEQLEILGVVTRPDRRAGRGLRPVSPPVCCEAKRLGLPVWQPERVNHPDFVGFLRSLQCDVIVVAAYGQILKRDLLSLPPLGCINVHASLLPQYRGPDPIRWTLLNGEEVTGVTIMLMDEGVDTGPILAQESLPILPEDTYASLTEKLGTLGGKLLREVLPAWKEGRITPRPQEGEPSYAPVVEKEKARICWESPAWYIVRQVRAFFPSPGAYTFFAGKRLKILEASWEGSDGTPCSPGTIHHVEREKGIVVCAGEGLVAIHRLQPEGGRAMSSWEFVCGYRLSVGQRMGEEVR